MSTATRLERVDTGAVHVYGDLVTPSGRRHPITLPPQDWEALETALAVHGAMSDLGAPVPDLHAIEAKWLVQCPAHDAGLPAECACPDGDAREVIRQLVAEVYRGIEVARDGYEKLCKRFVDQPWKTRQEIDAMRFAVVEAVGQVIGIQAHVAETVSGPQRVHDHQARAYAGLTKLADHLRAAVDALDGAP